MLGMNAAGALAGAMEDVLAPLHQAQRLPEPDATALLLEGSALLRGLIFEPVGAEAAQQRRLVEALRDVIDRASDHEQQRDAKNPAMDKAAPGAHRWCVLLVDEGPMTRMIVTAMLRDAGFDVDALPAGEAALRRLRAELAYDLLVIGERVRGIEPTALAAVAHAERPNLPIIVVGAANADSDPDGGILGYVSPGRAGQAQLVALAQELGQKPPAAD
jgi:CheY-like chemotaxis protein